MGRFSPTVLPDYYGGNPGQAFADAIGSYIGLKRQEKQDKLAAEEHTWRGETHQRDIARADKEDALAPLHEALLRAQLYQQGVVPIEEDAAPGTSAPRAGDSMPLLDAIQAQRQKESKPGFGGPVPGVFSNDKPVSDFMREAQKGLLAPGSFNPVSGGFNPPAAIDPGFTRPPASRFPGDPGEDAGFGHGAVPRFSNDPGIDPGFTRPPAAAAPAATPQDTGRRGPGARVPMGKGFVLDPSLTKRGQDEADIRKQIDAMIASGIDPDRAEAMVRSNLTGAMTDELQDPVLRLEKELGVRLPYELALIWARGLMSEKVARIRKQATAHQQQREDLTRVERQVDDTRADLSNTQRAKPDKKNYGGRTGKPRDQYKTDVQTWEDRVNELRHRADSLGTVRDSLAAEVQGHGYTSPPPRRKITPDQRDYLKAMGKWDESKYEVLTP